MQILKSFWLILCFIVPTVTLFKFTKSSGAKTICKTDECQKIVQQLIDQLAPEVDPCDNFYDFVCRKKIAKIEQDASPFVNASLRQTVYTELQHLVDSQLRQLLENETSASSSQPAETQGKKSPGKLKLRKFSFDTAQKYYRECMRLLPTWPYTSGNHSGYDWTQDLLTNAKLDHEIDWILKLNVIDSADNKLVLDVQEPSLIFDRDLLRNPTKENRARLLMNVVTAMDLTNDYKAFLYEDVFRELIDFEIGLVKLMKPPTNDFEDDQQQPIKSKLLRLKRPENIPSLKHTIGWIDQRRYSIFEPIGFAKFTFARIHNRQPLDITEFLRHMKIKVSTRSFRFLDDLDNYMAKVPKRVLKNYILWRAHTNEKISRAYQSKQVANFLHGYKPRWRKCLSLTKKNFLVSLTNEYLNRYLDMESVKIVRKMFENFKKVFEAVIMSTKWPDDQTKKAIVTKLRKMKAVIGDFNDPDAYFGKATRKEVRILRIYERLTEANAMYHPTFNFIVIPAAIIQGKMFDKRLPMMFNYATIGRVIGHEIGHAFDANNFVKDENGTVHTNSLWSSTSKILFWSKVNALIDRYSKFVEPSSGLNVRGSKTKNDDIADSTGILIAYLTYQFDKYDKLGLLDKLNYKDFDAKNEDDDSLIGLRVEDKNKFGLTDDQVFWVRFAGMSCSYFTPTLMKYMIVHGSHSPSRFRTIGVLQNNYNFAEDFQCALNTNMNPSVKINFWF